MGIGEMCTCFYLKIHILRSLPIPKPLKGGLGVSDQGDVHSIFIFRLDLGYNIVYQLDKARN